MVNLHRCNVISHQPPQIPSHANTYQCNAIITSYIKHGEGQKALDLYNTMRENGIQPDKFTFSCVLKACSGLGALFDGMLIHEQVIKSGLQCEVVIGTALIDMYAKCGGLNEARRTFDGLSDRNIITWGAMLAGYVQHGFGLHVLELLKDMHNEGIEPSNVTSLCAIKACAIDRNLTQGMLVHDQIIRKGLYLDMVIGNTLVDMYARCGKLEEAYRIFTELPRKTIVSWGAMIAGYVQHGYGPLARSLYKIMQDTSGLKPDNVIFSCVLKACGSDKAIEEGRQIHRDTTNSGFHTDKIVGSALVDMYAKCGHIDEAVNTFCGLPTWDVVIWSTMIAAYAHHGDALSVLDIYKKMRVKNIKPNKSVYLFTLKACGSEGAINQGRIVHDHALCDEFEPDVTIASCLIDMYTKCGNLKEAQKVFHMLTSPDTVSWNAMIAGSAFCGNLKIALKYFSDMQKQGLTPGDSVYTSILTACCRTGLVVEGSGFLHFLKTGCICLLDIEHCSCLVDLLGRSGFLIESEALLNTIPIPPDAIILTSLLSACQIYGNVCMGQRSVANFVDSISDDASELMLLSSIYAKAQMWEEADELENARRSMGAWKKPGKASMEVDSMVHEFFVGDESPYDEVFSVKLTSLRRSMKLLTYVPQLDTILDLMT